MGRGKGSMTPFVYASLIFSSIFCHPVSQCMWRYRGGGGGFGLSVTMTLVVEKKIGERSLVMIIMGVARILERVVRTTSRDKGDVTMMTAWSSHIPRSIWSQGGDDNLRSWSSTSLPPGSARHNSSTATWLVSTVLRWKRSVILLFAVGGSAVDCLRCRFDTVYAMSVLMLHLLQ